MELSREQSSVVIIGAATSLGQPINGAEKGPNALRDGGHLHKTILELGHRVDDRGDLDANNILEGDLPVGLTKNPRSVGYASKLIHDAVKKAHEEGNFVLTLGGDHSLAIGSISGVLASNPNTCVVWVDAHGDINTPAISGSGNIHGMPAAFLTGIVRDHIPGFEWLAESRAFLPTERLAFIGLRDVDTSEKLALHEAGAVAYSMHEVDRLGIAEVMRRVLATINPNGDLSIHLSFDIDGLDPSHALSTGTRVPGGLTLREGRYICEELAATGRLRSMDMAEVNPAIFPDDTGETIRSAHLMIRAALGHTLIHTYHR